MADFQLTQGKAAPFTAKVTKAGDPTTEVPVDSIVWVADGVALSIEGQTDALTGQVRGLAAGVGTLKFSARRSSDGLQIEKVVSVEVVVPTEPAPDVTITMGVEV